MKAKQTQKQSQPAVIITRERLGQWGSIAGAVGLLVGIVGLIWQAGFSPFVVGALATGAVGIGLWATMTPDEFTAFMRGRQARQSTSAIFATLLLIGIVTLLYIFLQRAVITVDMTANTRFTLSPETLSLIARVDRDVQITGFYSPAILQQREVDDRFIRLYETASGGRIHRVYVDPEEQPIQAQQFSQIFGVVADGTVFISFLTPEGTVDLSQTLIVFTPETRSTNQERDITNALNRLFIRGSLTIYFTIDRGELDALNTRADGLANTVSTLMANGLVTSFLDLSTLAAEGGSIPDDAAAVVMARPLTDLGVPEIEVLDRYLSSGGSLLLLTDIVFGEASPFLAENGPFNQYLWQRFGIRALDAVVVDPQVSFQNPLDVIGNATSTSTSIGVRLGGDTAPLLFHIPRALEISPEPPVNNGWVVLSSPYSFAKRDFGALLNNEDYSYDVQTDSPGEQALVVWAWNTETDARILLVGDGDFITNVYFDSNWSGNRVLLFDGLTWLMDVEQQIGFAPQFYSSGSPLISVAGTQLDIIAFVTIILVPGLVLVSGAVVWWRRSRR